MPVPTKKTLLDEHAAKEVTPVFRISVMPDIDRAMVDWTACTHSAGPRYALMDESTGINLEISKGVPRAAVVSGLRNIIDFLEQSSQDRDAHVAFQQAADWFED